MGRVVPREEQPVLPLNEEVCTGGLVGGAGGGVTETPPSGLGAGGVPASGGEGCGSFWTTMGIST